MDGIYKLESKCNKIVIYTATVGFVGEKFASSYL